MKILVTNDDGIGADGLAVLAKAAAQFGEVYTVAPIGAKSGCSHQVTSHDPVRMEEHGLCRWAIGGFPADCVRVALQHLNIKPDWVFSGVNHGGNLGVDVYLSGTVAAVREGAIYGIPGIGFSHYRKKDRDFDWDCVARNLPKVIEHVFAKHREVGDFWNVNFPHLTEEEGQPPLVDCRLDTAPMAFQWRHQDMTLEYLSEYHARPRTPGGDVATCFGGGIAIAKLRLV